VNKEDDDSYPPQQENALAAYISKILALYPELQDAIFPARCESVTDFMARADYIAIAKAMEAIAIFFHDEIEATYSRLQRIPIGEELRYTDSRTALGSRYDRLTDLRYELFEFLTASLIK
jgi:hypothetical protein